MTEYEVEFIWPGAFKLTCKVPEHWLTPGFRPITKHTFDADKINDGFFLRQARETNSVVDYMCADLGNPKYVVFRYSSTVRI